MKQVSLRPAIRYATRGGLIACLVTLAAGESAKADPHQNLFVAGAQYSQSSQFAYLGTVMPIAGGALGDGYFVSPFVSWNRYTFQKNGDEFIGREPSASLGIGRAWTTKRFSLSLSIAGGYSNTSLSPYAPRGSLRGSQWFAEPELYAHMALPAGASLTVNGGYLTGLRSYWVTTYLLAPVTHSISIGPEADFGGGINYRNHTIALRVADQLTSSLALSVSGGALTSVPGSYHPYVALGLNVPFQ